MFDANRLLSGLLGNAMSGTRYGRSSGLDLPGLGRIGGGSMGAIGLLGGIAAGAMEHFGEKNRAGAQPPPAAPPGQGYPPAGHQPGYGPPPPPGAVGPGAMPPPPPPPGGQATGPSGAAPPPPPIPGGQAAGSGPPHVEPETAMLLIHAMIAAAKADGEVDAAEMQGILGRLERAGISAEERAFLMTELTRPLDLDALVAKVTDPEMAPEVYAASLLAITVDTQAEEAYLRTLAEKLQLDSATVAHLHQQFNAPLPG